MAVLAQCMEAAFAPLAELWFNKILKQTCQKTQVFSSAADRSLRIVLSSSSAGYPRLLPLLLEAGTQKASPTMMRNNAIQYACLISALWKPDILERYSAAVSPPHTSDFFIARSCDVAGAASPFS